MDEVYQFFSELAGNFEFITFGIIGIIVFLLLIILFTGKKKTRKPGQLATGTDLSLDQVMAQLRDTSENVQMLITEYRSQIGEQEKQSVERQMQVQKLEEQIYQMKSELQMLDDAPQDLKDKIKEINHRTATQVQRRVNRNNYTMLIIGFLLGIVGVIIGRYFANNTEQVLSWFQNLAA